MPMVSGDTIFAMSSAPPPALRVIVRLSGARAWPAVASRIVGTLVDCGSWRGDLRVAGVEVPADIYVFRGPRSYTGEDLVELHVPGSPWVVGRLLAELGAEGGVRVAEPGEFTARAYLNGRMDLTAAEGVAAAVSAADERHLRAARQLLSGTLAAKVRALAERVATLLALLEVGIDFSDEDVSFVSRGQLQAELGEVAREIAGMLSAGARFGSLSAVPSIVVVGRPNAGKSTLVNALLGRERSVVSDVAGTTRDVLWSELKLPCGLARIADVAGVSHEGGERFTGEMNRAALGAAAAADVLVLAREEPGEAAAWLPRPADLRVSTKADLGRPGREGDLAVSARSGTGMRELRETLDALCFGRDSGAGVALTARHQGCLAGALGRVHAAVASLGLGEEIVAAEMRGALDDLGAVTGEISPDEVLGRVFSAFCIGK